jgi:hypothetical protein
VGDYILQADSGVLDAVWRRKEAKAQDLRAIQDSFGQRLDEIGRALAEIEAEGSEDEVESLGIPGRAAEGEGDE